MRWICLAVLLCTPLACAAADADGDRLPDDVELLLGTDPAIPEVPQPVATYPAQPDRPGRFDIVELAMAPVARDRTLFAVRFREPYAFDNTVFILYLDADGNPATGRQGLGCEGMYGLRNGAPSAGGFAADGSAAPATPPRLALVDGVLYLCVDSALRQVDGRTRVRVSLLSETAEPKASVDGTGWVEIDAPPAVDRPRPGSMEEVTVNDGFFATEGLELLQRLHDDPANVVLRTVDGELTGLRYYDAEYRWPAVVGATGAVTVIAPRAGRFHAGLVVYDTAGEQKAELYHNGRRVGAFIAREDDRRQRLFVTEQPLDLAQGDRLLFRLGDAVPGSYILEDVLLLAQRPAVVERRFEIERLEGTWDEAAGAARLTWTTTWPAACQVSLRTPGGETQAMDETDPVANHRVVFPDKTPGARLTGEVKALDPRGREHTARVAFVAAPPRPARLSARRERMAVLFRNPSPVDVAGHPVTMGLPFSPGEIDDASRIRLLGPDGQEVPCQAAPAVRYPDGSLKWARLDFAGTAPAGGTAAYTAEYGRDVTPAQAAGLTVRDGEHELVVDTGALRVMFDRRQSALPFRIDRDGHSVFGDRHPVVTLQADETFSTANPPDELVVEEAGPQRVVVRATGRHTSEGNTAYFGYVVRTELYAGSADVRVRYAFLNDVTDRQDAPFDSLVLSLPRPEGAAATLGGDQPLPAPPGTALRQWADDAYTVSDGSTGRRAEGWAHLAGLGGFAVKHFWQLWPKGLSVGDESVDLELCPALPAGQYAGKTLLEDIHWFFALRTGRYVTRQGTRREHDLLWSFGAADADAARRAWQAFETPPVAHVEPERYEATGVFGEMVPKSAGSTPEYEAMAERVYTRTAAYRETSKDYGLLNFGDQFGERKVNWANGEYDHHHAMLVEFARTGDPRWIHLAEPAARHAIDVDLCHFGPNRGVEWIHSMGHTGIYFDTPYEGSGIPRGGSSVSHTWTEGFTDWHALTGDVTALEAAQMVADRFAGSYLNNYDYNNGRDSGWHLLLTLATYRATGDPYYLNAAHIMVERILERQDPRGGWVRQMVPGHCYCTPRHRGEANFMLGVLCNGLWEHYKLTRDPRVAEALVGGAKQVLRELWVPEVDGFRYTSCPEMKGYTANNDMTVPVLLYAWRINHDPEYAEVSQRAMGEAYESVGTIAHLRWMPAIAATLKQMEEAAPRRAEPSR